MVIHVEFSHSFTHPLTLPSFFPVPTISNSTPAHIPDLNSVGPRKRNVPQSPRECIATRCPMRSWPSPCEEATFSEDTGRRLLLTEDTRFRALVDLEGFGEMVVADDATEDLCGVVLPESDEAVEYRLDSWNISSSEAIEVRLVVVPRRNVVDFDVLG
jgi:hypothetical protein